MRKEILRTALLFAAMGKALRPPSDDYSFSGARRFPTPKRRRRKISKYEQKKRARIHRLSVNRETR